MSTDRPAVQRWTKLGSVALGTECHPLARWRCRVWRTIEHDVATDTRTERWNWEARRFSSGKHVHVSGEAATEKQCKVVAVAAAKALEARR